MYKFLFFLFVFNLLIFRAIAQEAAALCALVKSTNINSKKSDWSCGNTASRCSWDGVTCQDGNIHEINIANFGGLGIDISHNFHINFPFRFCYFICSKHWHLYITHIIYHRNTSYSDRESYKSQKFVFTPQFFHWYNFC